MLTFFKSSFTLAPKLLCAASLVAGLSLSLTTNASVIDLKVDADDATSYSFGNSVKTKGLFSDSFIFSFNNISDLSFGIVSIPGSKKNISGLSFELFHDISNTNSESLGFFGQAASLMPTPSTAIEHDFLKVAAGNYHVEITGNAFGTKGGTYAGSMSVSAVPEPESYAMILAGLGLIAVISRRRKKLEPSLCSA